MEYKEFINKLYIKGKGIKKEELTKRLFISSVSNPSVITDKRNSYSSFKGYNRGNPISEIANDVLGNLNEEGIKSFLKDLFKSNLYEKDENIQKICNRFKDDIPDITAENMCEKIAVFFIDEVLKTAAEKNNCKSKNLATKNDQCDSSGCEFPDINEQGPKEDTNIPPIDDNNNNKKEEPVSKNTNSFTDNHVEDKSVKITNISTTNDNHVEDINVNINNTSIINNYVCIKGNSSVEGKNIEHIENELQTAEDPIKVLMISLKEIVNNLIEIGNKIASRKIKPIVPKLAVSPEIYEALTQSNVPSKITLELDNEFERLQDLYDVIYRYNAENKNETLDSILELILNTNEKAFIETWNSLTIMTLKNQSVFNLMTLIQDYFQVKDE